MKNRDAAAALIALLVCFHAPIHPSANLTHTLGHLLLHTSKQAGVPNQVAAAPAAGFILFLSSAGALSCVSSSSKQHWHSSGSTGTQQQGPYIMDFDRSAKLKKEQEKRRLEAQKRLERCGLVCVYMCV